MGCVMGGGDGRVMGGVTGGMTGGMKFAESLYLKGSAPSDGRDGALSLESQQKSENETKLCSMLINKKRLIFNTHFFQKCSLTGNRTFPSEEPVIDDTTSSSAHKKTKKRKILSILNIYSIFAPNCH